MGTEDHVQSSHQSARTWLQDELAIHALSKLVVDAGIVSRITRRIGRESGKLLA